MRRVRTNLVLASLMGVALAGCRIPGYEGPVSQSLATSRQYSIRGVAALERGQRQDAEQWLSKAVKACPADPEARRNFAEALWQRDAKKEAVAQLKESLRLSGEDATLRVRLAEMYLVMGQTDLAMQNADLAISANTKLASAWAIRGQVRRVVGDFPQAMADSQRALGYAPEDRRILADVAELYLALGQPQAALQTAQNLAESYSPGEEPQRVMHLLGLACLAAGRHEDAIENLTAAANREKPNVEILYRLAEAEVLAGHPARAADAAQEALRLEPTHAASRELLGRIDLAQQPGTTR